MTDEQINAAIAEVCGWWGNRKGNCMRPPNRTDMYCEIPNYCTDLNAMHLAEKVLNKEQEKNYFANLRGIVGDLVWYRTVGKTYRATARERAEAFLKTLGLWKEATTEECSADQKEVQK